MINPSDHIGIRTSDLPIRSAAMIERPALKMETLVMK